MTATLTDPPTINPRLVTIPRIRVMRILAEFDADGISYRELKAGLSDMTDGNLVATMHSLRDLGCLTSHRETVATKRITIYTITPDGKREWNEVRRWLRDWTQPT